MRVYLEKPFTTHALSSTFDKAGRRKTLQPLCFWHKSASNHQHISNSYSRTPFESLAKKRAPTLRGVRGMAAASAQQEGSNRPADTILQYIVVRRDLYETMKWPLGSIIAQAKSSKQACHAATAALWESRSEEMTLEYTEGEQLNHMHKVVLEAKGETQLQNLSSKLQEAGIRHKLWMEQPENIPTCIAAAPYRKSIVQPFFKKFKLCGS